MVIDKSHAERRAGVRHGQPQLADGILRLLGFLPGITARLKVGRTAKSTVDTYWLVVAGAPQVEQLLDLVSDSDALEYP